jgi:hypothetical protein
MERDPIPLGCENHRESVTLKIALANNARLDQIGETSPLARGVK